MDVSRLRRGEQIAGIAGIALFIIMFLNWFSVDTNGVSTPFDTGLSAWQSFSFIDIVLFITVIAALALAAMSATQTRVDMPVALSAIVVGLGVLSVILIIIRIIFQPDISVAGIDTGIETNPSYGVFLGLIAAAGITYGGWLAMQEEGASFTAQRDRTRGPGGGPPPPPAGGPPPPSGGPPPAGGTPPPSGGPPPSSRP